jgi:hypothetical protein
MLEIGGQKMQENKMDKLKSFLEKRGYKFYRTYLDKGNLCDWYACKRTTSARECTSNKKPVQIVVNPYMHNYSGSITESVEIDITAEFNSVWWKLEAYSLSPKDAIKKLDIIEKSLVKAWEAL